MFVYSSEGQITTNPALHHHCRCKPSFIRWDWFSPATESSHIRKSDSDVVKTENRSRKQSHKLDWIEVIRIRTVWFSSDSACDSDIFDLVKSGLSESQAEAEGPANRNASSQALPVQSSACQSESSVSIASKAVFDSVGLIFTRSFRSALLITTPTPS